MIAGACRGDIEEAGFATFVCALFVAALCRQPRRRWRGLPAFDRREARFRDAGQVDYWELQSLAGVNGHHANHVGQFFSIIALALASTAAVLPQRKQRSEER